MGIKKSLKPVVNIFDAFFFSIPMILAKWRGVPVYISNVLMYSRKNKSKKFNIRISNMNPCLVDRFSEAGSMRGHYFHQDLWASSQIFIANPLHHVDIGSRLDGFIAQLLVFRSIMYVDIRKIETKNIRLKFIEGSITKMPFENDSLESVSSLHVLEHIGLGRYGDNIDPLGYLAAAKEIVRVLKPGGVFYLGTPVGKEVLYFDAHRVFDPATIVDAFEGLTVESFSLIDDGGTDVLESATFEDARKCNYGCGLFKFKKI
jgi:SAM-dependent methyltransferase